MRMQCVWMTCVLAIAALAAGLVSTPSFAADTPPSDIAGIALGATLADVDAKCKSPGWACRRSTKRVRGKDIAIVIAEPPKQLAYRRINYFLAEGRVFSVTARYLARESSRYRTLAATYGPGSRDRKGRSRWVSADGARVAVLSQSGVGFTLIGVDRGSSAGVYSSAESARLIERLHLTPTVAAQKGMTLEDVKTAKERPAPVATPGLRLERLPDRITVLKGLPATIGVKVTNVAEGTSSKMPIQFRYAEQEDGAAIDLINDVVPPVKAHHSSDVATSLIFPASASIGNHRIDVVLDDQKRSIPVSIVPAGPDLAITLIKAPKSAAAGANVPIEIVVWNIGNRPTTEGFSVFLFHLEGTSPKNAASDSAYATYKGPALAPQKHVALTASLNMPAFHFGEVITLRAQVQSAEDADRTNNNKRTDMTIEMPPTSEPAVDVEIPVKILVDSLECLEKGEIGSDEPYLHVTALQTVGPNPKVFGKRAWESIADNPWDYPWWTSIDDESRFGAININLFSDNQTVRFGESVGFHVSLWEEDWGPDPDDEIGFVTPTFRFGDLYKNVGRTLSLAEDMADEDGDGRYRIHYRLTIGMPKQAPLPKSKFETVNWAAWAGAYELRMGGETLDVNLVYEASLKNGLVDGRSHPHGRLRGRFKDNANTLETQRLWGNYWEFTMRKSHGSSRRFVGYLIGDERHPSIAGTVWNDEAEAGFVMTRPGGAR